MKGASRGVWDCLPLKLLMKVSVGSRIPHKSPMSPRIRPVSPKRAIGKMTRTTSGAALHVFTRRPSPKLARWPAISTDHGQSPPSPLMRNVQGKNVTGRGTSIIVNAARCENRKSQKIWPTINHLAVKSSTGASMEPMPLHQTAKDWIASPTAISIPLPRNA